MFRSLNTLRFEFVLLICCILGFWPLYSAKYINGDDLFLIVHNPVLKLDFVDALKASFSIFMQGDYLPFFQISYWVENYFFPTNSLASHLINLSLHFMNVLLFLYWLRLQKIQKLVVVFAVLIFALHPLQVESVAWASERKGLLASMFFLLALISYEEKKLSLVTLFFIFSLLSKATYIMLPFWFLIKAPRKNISLFSVLSLISIIFAIVRIDAMLSYVQTAPIDFEHVLLFFTSLPTALGHYILSFFWPLKLSLMYPLESQMHFLGIEFWVFLIFSFIFTGLAYRSKQKKSAFLHLLLVFLVLFPVLNFSRAEILLMIAICIFR